MLARKGERILSQITPDGKASAPRFGAESFSGLGCFDIPPDVVLTSLSCRKSCYPTEPTLSTLA